jgi:hypothetical protein
MRFGKIIRSAASVATVVAALTIAHPAHADIIWNWSFGGEAGTFTTDGTSNGTPTNGLYDFVDFSVTSSTAGATIGSASGGRYIASGFQSSPSILHWNGSSVVLWEKTGANLSQWWVFTEVSDPSEFIEFGLNEDEDADPTQAMAFTCTLSDGICVNNPTVLDNGTVSLSVDADSTVSEPTTIALFGLGLAGIGLIRRRNTA